jgi:phosphomannomutase/phosphomannomutase/phosphoglucomutase
MTYFSTFHLPEVNGAIMETGSHNPPEYNGFKISVGNSTIFGHEIQNLKKIIEDKAYIEGTGDESQIDISPEYVARYKSEFGDLSGVKVVLDCGNGTAGCVARRMYEAVGLKPTILFEEPDGDFPNHHPDPTVEKNLVDLKAKVIEEGAQLGIGFDGDSDRIGVVDNEGKTIFGDELIALYSKQILRESPGQKIIGDVKCSDRMYDYIDKYGGVPIMWKTGHSLVKQKVKQENAPFGGELSGHIFFADRNYGYDDALYAGLRVIEILSKTGQTIAELLTDLPKAYNTPEIRIDTTEEKKYSIVKKLVEVYKDNSSDVSVNLIDGIRLSFKDGWALARASNTQPVLVMRFEASSPEGLDRIRKEVEGIVNPLL